MPEPNRIISIPWETDPSLLGSYSVKVSGKVHLEMSEIATK